MLNATNNRAQPKTVTLTNKECQFMIAVFKYELNLVVQLPDRKRMRPSIEGWLRKFQNGKNRINPQSDRIGQVNAGGELLVEIDEYRLYHVYNVDDWGRSQAVVYGRLRAKITRSMNPDYGRFRMGA